MLVRIYPENPSQKEINKVVETLQDGGLVIYPTDAAYAIGCGTLNVCAVGKICQMKGVNPQKSNLSIICYDLSNLNEYAEVNNAAFELIKKHLPGPFTFILPTNSELPKTYKNRKGVGVRVPDNNITRTLVQSLGNPVLTMSIRNEDEVVEHMTDPELIHKKYERQVDIVIDGSFGGLKIPTAISCMMDNFEIVRQGKGELQSSTMTYTRPFGRLTRDSKLTSCWSSGISVIQLSEQCTDKIRLPTSLSKTLIRLKDEIYGSALRQIVLTKFELLFLISALISGPDFGG